MSNSGTFAVTYQTKILNSLLEPDRRLEENKKQH